MIGRAYVSFACVYGDCPAKEIRYGKCKHLKSGDCLMGVFYTPEELEEFLSEFKTQYMRDKFLDQSGLFAQENSAETVETKDYSEEEFFQWVGYMIKQGSGYENADTDTLRNIYESMDKEDREVNNEQ
jgi:hypothetical protein